VRKSRILGERKMWKDIREDGGVDCRGRIFHKESQLSNRGLDVGDKEV